MTRKVEGKMYITVNLIPGDVPEEEATVSMEEAEHRMAEEWRDYLMTVIDDLESPDDIKVVVNLKEVEDGS